MLCSLQEPWLKVWTELKWAVLQAMMFSCISHFIHVVSTNRDKVHWSQHSQGLLPLPLSESFKSASWSFTSHRLLVGGQLLMFRSRINQKEKLNVELSLFVWSTIRQVQREQNVWFVWTLQVLNLFHRIYRLYDQTPIKKMAIKVEYMWQRVRQINDRMKSEFFIWTRIKYKHISK